MEVAICIKASYFMSAFVPQKMYSVLWSLAELNFHVVHNIFMSPMKSHIKWKEPRHSLLEQQWNTTTHNTTQWCLACCFTLHSIYRKAERKVVGREMDGAVVRRQMKVEIVLRKGSTPQPCFGTDWLAMDCDGFSSASPCFGSGGKLKRWTDLMNDRFVVAAPIVPLALLHWAV